MQDTGLLTHPTFRLVDGSLIASILPRQLMGSRIGPSVEWGNEGDECVICISEMVDGEEVSEIPTCHHTFHSECLTKWLETKVAAVETGRCPVCNNVFMSPVLYVIPSQTGHDPPEVTPPEVTQPVVTPQNRLLTNCSWNSVAVMICVALMISSLVLIVVISVMDTSVI